MSRRCSSGALGRIQSQARREFMRPERVAARVAPLVTRMRGELGRLTAAVQARDLLGVCGMAGRLMFRIVTIPLIKRGIAPSSTRHYMQLSPEFDALRHELSALEGATDADVSVALALHAISARMSAVCPPTGWGRLPEYMLRKSEWLARHGHVQAAMHAMWNDCAARANDCLDSGDRHVMDAARVVAADWLGALQWLPEQKLSEKLVSIESLVQAVDTVAA